MPNGVGGCKQSSIELQAPPNPDNGTAGLGVVDTDGVAETDSPTEGDTLGETDVEGVADMLEEAEGRIEVLEVSEILKEGAAELDD